MEVEAQAPRWARMAGLRRHPVLRRLGAFFLALGLVVVINFWLPRALPGNPILSMENSSSALYLSNPVLRARIEAYYGLNQPLGQQFATYLDQLAHGSLGWSIEYNQPVEQMIAQRLPWTLLLVVPALLLATLITIVGGTEAGWRRGGKLDSALAGLFTALTGFPVYLAALAAIIVGGVVLGWFPIAGATSPFSQTLPLPQQVLDVLHHWALPEAVLVLELIGTRYLVVRSGVVAVLGQNFMLVARAKGLGEGSLKYRHAARNALLPLLTGAAAQLGFAVGGTILIETAFAYPGMGLLVSNAVAYRDYPVMQASFLVLSVAVLLSTLLADLVLLRLDPRAVRS